MISKAITVGTTATLLADGNEDRPQEVIVFVAAAGQSVFLGGPDVTTGNGVPIATGTNSPALKSDGPLYGIVAATTQAVHVLRQGG